MKFRNKSLIAIVNISMWINDHFYYFLEGEIITSQATISFIKNDKALLRKTKEAS